MKTELDCIPCFARQAVRTARVLATDTEVQERAVREACRVLGEIDMRQPPPMTAQRVYQLILAATGHDDPYRDLRHDLNRCALMVYPQYKRRVESSTDPFASALRLAIASNAMDVGINGDLAASSINTVLEQAEQVPVRGDVEGLRAAVQRSKDVLYLGDNAGEIVFDRLLIEQMPREHVTYVVRGGPTLNDVTLEDAKMVGLATIVDVIDNGSDAPGTILEQCWPSFRGRFEQADLIIAKGQGNYESLSDVTDKTIYFLLKAKCPVVAEHLNCTEGALVVHGIYEPEASDIIAGNPNTRRAST